MTIHVNNITKRFGGFDALTNVSLDVPHGGLTALLGPSGSGKSTLLRVIAGLEQPDTGTVTLAGTDATALPPRRRGIGFVFQHYAAFKHLTVAKNIAFGLEIRRRPRSETRTRVDQLLELVQLEGYAGHYPSQLSGGQRQRMALARALAVEPEILLLDEPFGALDARVRKDLRDWLRRLHDQIGVTTLIVTHDQEEAMEVADHIAIMNHGQIEQHGTPPDLYEHPANEFVMRFMGQVERLNGHLVRPHDIQLGLHPNGTTVPARILRVLHLGYEKRVELTLQDGEQLTAQLSHAESEQLALTPGQTIYAHARNQADVSPRASSSAGRMNGEDSTSLAQISTRRPSSSVASGGMLRD